jgi:hypothetical protein
MSPFLSTDDLNEVVSTKLILRLLLVDLLALLLSYRA